MANDYIGNYSGTRIDEILAKADTSVYTKTEVNSALSGKVDKVQDMGLSEENFTSAEKQKLASLVNYNDQELRAAIARIYGLGEAIASGQDLNSITADGTYCCDSASKAQTLINCPVTSSFRLEVCAINAANRHLQKIYPNKADFSEFYIRCYTNTGWGDWFRFSGTAVN